MATTRGIVVGREPFGEADLYIRFFTKNHGLITVSARNARKSRRRYIGGLDLFCHDELSLRGDPKGRPYLTELTVLNAFVGLRDVIERVMAAGRIAQWVRKLADTATPLPGVYSLLGQTLALLERESDPQRIELLTLIFKVKLLSELGLKPRMDTCVQCEQDVSEELESGAFDLGAGGIVCAACCTGRAAADRVRLEARARFFLGVADELRLTAWAQLEFEQFFQEQGLHLSRLVTQFASYHTQVRLPV